MERAAAAAAVVPAAEMEAMEVGRLAACLAQDGMVEKVAASRWFRTRHAHCDCMQRLSNNPCHPLSSSPHPWSCRAHLPSSCCSYLRLERHYLARSKRLS